jgi:hypothetical protein
MRVHFLDLVVQLANILNTDRPAADERGGKASTYEELSKGLQERAREIGILGRSRMDKDELIDALRSY